MAGKKSIDELGRRLGRDAVDTVARANKIVAKGVRKLADQELKALSDYYATLIGQIKAARRGESMRDLASQQLDTMQETVLRMIDNARVSLDTVADVRAELAKLVQRGEKQAKKTDFSAVTEPAEAALKTVQKLADDAQAAATSAIASARQAGAEVDMPSPAPAQPKAPAKGKRKASSASGKAKASTASVATSAAAPQEKSSAGTRKRTSKSSSTSATPAKGKARAKTKAADTPATPKSGGRRKSPAKPAASAPAKSSSPRKATAPKKPPASSAGNQGGNGAS